MTLLTDQPSEDDFRLSLSKSHPRQDVKRLLILSLLIVIRYVPYCSSDAWSGNASKWETGGKDHVHY